jgi:HSP20 family protein
MPTSSPTQQTTPQPQTIPVQINQNDELIVLAAPMPGLEPQDITVSIAADRVKIQGEYRGSRQDSPELIMSEWTIGPYFREIVLEHPVNGSMTNASYGNGVLALSMPKLRQGEESEEVAFRLEVVDATKGQRVGHTGTDMRPTTTHEYRQRSQQNTDEHRRNE